MLSSVCFSLGAETSVSPPRRAVSPSQPGSPRRTATPMDGSPADSRVSSGKYVIVVIQLLIQLLSSGRMNNVSCLLAMDVSIAVARPDQSHAIGLRIAILQRWAGAPKLQ